MKRNYSSNGSRGGPLKIINHGNEKNYQRVPI